MASWSSDAWTEQEQQLLEEGLVKFVVICDVKEKWKAIAGHVGTRDLRACADRFKVCRQRALEQQKAQEEEEAEEEEDGQEADWRQSDWSQWKTDDWWSGQWWNGWQDRSWKEEAPMDEADRRKSEVQQEIEANRRKMEQKEEQKRRQEEVREAKLRAEREQKEKERQEQQQAREQKITEAREREKQQRLEEENRQRELRRKMEEDDAKAGFYGKRHLHVKGGLKGGKGWGKGPSKGEISRQRREEEMEKNAREVLANIKSKKGADVPEISGADAADADASETSPPDADVALPKKGAHEESDSKGDGKGKGKNGKKGDGKGKHKKEARIERWWTKIDGDCPISLVPIAELPVPPFGLKADGSSVPHYFDGRFLASFLLSSFDFINPVNRTPLSREDCVALDAHLRDYPDRGVSRSASQGNVTDAFDLFQRNGGTGTDAVRREATAVFQHLFRFTHSQNLDSRGRAINFNDGGLTVIDDDDIRVSAAQHTVASTAQVLAESEREEVAAGPGPSVSNVPGPSGAWAKASSPQPEEFPALPGAKAKAGSKAKAKMAAAGKAKGKAKANSGGTRGLLAPKTWATPK